MLLVVEEPPSNPGSDQVYWVALETPVTETVVLLPEQNDVAAMLPPVGLVTTVNNALAEAVEQPEEVTMHRT